MTPTLTPLHHCLGYLVEGLDTSRPLAPGVQELLRGALATRGLLVFRDQQLGDEQQVAFARIFGRISKQGPIQRISPDATYVSNVRRDGAFGDVELNFHSDQMYFDHPLKAIMLYGIEVPSEGGETLFSNSAAAVERMPSTLREQLAGRSVLASLDYGALRYGDELRSQVQVQVAQATHPAIAVHQASGQTIHMMSPDTTRLIEGYDADTSAELIAQVSDIVADEAYVYRHVWRAGDLIVWDNTLLQHARSKFAPSAPRTLRRCAIASDNEPVEVPPALVEGVPA
ncbi:Alpha-ketoglutarate-dependent 2,4-dichlorophenoxyacetate dioxygenase [Variovorax sp. PBS-H4]|uniref:TauD/TfdA dioxygenase family protein n=1 Tax=Variovorax sp. PBS-H4 TaxID=434008 RepID=UPI0013194C80|nr:TauD/TfdA family dioxygenase [Variovorax sp. PBS-H4]VTU22913.1 Alpha-ketoglutarate-dependent 2,4-dichlorophenoxyacetate dioxygenase [Variovorax sp. PBS-H4]